MKARIDSIQSLGAVDGPGVRFVLFMQGCPLRCEYCHNPESWDMSGGEEMSLSEIMEKLHRYRNYFGKDGGLTVSGGEPLCQAEFVYELFKLCHYYGINTALDTSGCILNDTVKKVIAETDTVLLDYKMTNADDYKKHIGCDIEKVNEFLDYLESEKKTVWLRHVVVDGITNSDENAIFLKKLKGKYTCIKKIELLPFHKMCIEKYERLGIDFPLKDTKETSDERIQELYQIINS